MKYDTNTKTERNQAIIKTRKDNPRLSLEEIGEMFPVDGKPLSPQRVAQIIDKYSERV